MIVNVPNLHSWLNWISSNNSKCPQFAGLLILVVAAVAVFPSTCAAADTELMNTCLVRSSHLPQSLYYFCSVKDYVCWRQHLVKMILAGDISRISKYIGIHEPLWIYANITHPRKLCETLMLLWYLSVLPRFGEWLSVYLVATLMKFDLYSNCHDASVKQWFL